MSEELKSYLEKSKKKREKLKKIAMKLSKNLNNQEKSSNSAFPSVSPKRFKLFEEGISAELKCFFEPAGKASKFRSVSYKKKRISSIYLVDIPQKACFLPPLERSKERSVKNKVNKSRYCENIEETNSSILSSLSSKLVKTPCFSVNQSLFIPVLRAKHSIS